MSYVDPTASHPILPQPLAPAMEVMIGLGLILIFAYDEICKAVGEAQDRHRRAELLDAYRRRRHWKAADRAHLETLPLSPAARLKVARVAGRGRPVVRPHRELGDVLAQRVLPIAVFLNKTA